MCIFIWKFGEEGREGFRSESGERKENFLFEEISFLEKRVGKEEF